MKAYRECGPIFTLTLNLDTRRRLILNVVVILANYGVREPRCGMYIAFLVGQGAVGCIQKESLFCYFAEVNFL
jgi:hypothetical protein